MLPTISPVASAHDQARTLRELIVTRSSRETRTSAGPAGRSLAVLSGKGGVGKSVVALNLAVALAKQQQRVCLLDASAGLGSLELMCGLNGYWNLSHLMTGSRRLEEITLVGPEGIHLIPGASSLSELTRHSSAVQHTLCEQFQMLDHRYDFVIIDTGAGLHPLARQFARSADQMLIVTTPEPTSITDAYATMKSLNGQGRPPLSLVVNQVESVDLAKRVGERLKHTARMFLHTVVDCWGGVPRDVAVSHSVNGRRPLVCHSPDSPAAQAFSELADRWSSQPRVNSDQSSYFSRLLPRLQQAA